MAETTEIITTHWPGTTYFACLLVVVAIALFFACVRHWRRINHGALSDADLGYFRGQYQRRLGTSAVIGAIGAAMFADRWMPSLLAALWLWLGILGLVTAILILAIIDWFASRNYFQHVLREHAERREELLAEARAWRDQR